MCFSSSTMSEDASESHSDTKTQKPHRKHSSKESIIRKKSVSSVSQDDDDQDENMSQETPQSNIRPETKDGPEGQNIREECDSDEGEDDSCDIIVAKGKIRFRHVEEEDEEGTDDEVMGKRHEIEANGKEKPEMEDEGEEAGVDDEEVMGNRGGIAPSDNEEPDGDEDEGQTTEEEERENSFQDENEEGNIEGSADDDNKVNTSERDIHNRYQMNANYTY